MVPVAMDWFKFSAGRVRVTLTPAFMVAPASSGAAPSWALAASEASTPAAAGYGLPVYCVYSSGKGIGR